MRYRVGRACAVAGYSTLYKEVDLLSDIAITEEARGSVVRDPEDRGSHAILDHIVA